MRIRFDRQSFLRTAVVAALGIFIFVASPVMAQDTSSRLERIENEIQTLSRAVFKGETPPPGSLGGGSDSSVAEMQNRISQLETEIRNLTGQIEELTWQLNQMKPTQPSVQTSQQPAVTQTAPVMVNDPVLNGASTGMYVGGYDEPAQTTAPQVQEIGNTSVGQLGTISNSGDAATAAYENAFAMLRAQDYSGAQGAFDTFIKQYPNHKLVPNAMYWLGETYYVQNNFDQAVRVFAESYQKYPKGSKAPDNLLKLGMSLAGQGKTKEACIALMQLKKEYPAGATPVLERGDQEIQKLGCK